MSGVKQQPPKSHVTETGSNFDVLDRLYGNKKRKKIFLRFLLARIHTILILYPSSNRDAFFLDFFNERKKDNPKPKSHLNLVI